MTSLALLVKSQSVVCNIFQRATRTVRLLFESFFLSQVLVSASNHKTETVVKGVTELLSLLVNHNSPLDSKIELHGFIENDHEFNLFH